MASFAQYAPRLQAIEGGYVVDSGGPTFRGITLTTYRAWTGNPLATVADLKTLTWPQARRIYKRRYWDSLLADGIVNQSVAELLVDFQINGWPGVAWLQALVGVKADGVMGSKTLSALNAADPARLHARIMVARKAHYDRLIAQNPARYAPYRAGWAARLTKFAYAHQAAGLSLTGIVLLAGLGYYWYTNT